MKEAGGFLLLIGLLLIAVSSVLGLCSAVDALDSASAFVAGFVLGLIGAAMIDRAENAGR